MKRANVEWVNIADVMPNPLNPRQNDSVSSEEMQNIISNRGWEEPLTVYKKGKYFIVLSGHRRLYSAKQVGIKEVPVYIVESPKDHQEEIERIASLQGGRVDWTVYEWARFTYDRWIAWGKPSINEFAKRLNVGKTNIERDICVLDYFPKHEVDSGLLRGSLTVSQLNEARIWIKKLQRHKPKLVDDLGEDMIRRVMVKKLEDKLIVGRTHIRNEDFIRVASEDEIKDFLFSTDKHLQDCIRSLGIEADNVKSFHGHLVSIGLAKKGLDTFNPMSNDEKEKALTALEDLERKLSQKISRIKKDLGSNETIVS